MSNIELPKMSKVFRDGKRVIRYTIPENKYTGSDLTDINNMCPSYSIIIPKEGFRKNFNANELWYQMKMYCDTTGCELTAVVECLNAQKDTIATYRSNDRLPDGTMPLELIKGNGERYLPSISNTHLQILNMRQIPNKGYLYFKLTDGGDCDLGKQPLRVEIKGRTLSREYHINTDENGNGKLFIDLPYNQRYTAKAYFDGATIDNQVYNGAESSILTFGVTGKRQTRVETIDLSYITSKRGSTKTTYVVQGTDYDFVIYDKETGDPLPYINCYCVIDGDKKTLKSDFRGVVRCNVNNKEGTYKVKFGFDGNEQYLGCAEIGTYYMVVQHRKTVHRTVENSSHYSKQYKETEYNCSHNGKLCFCLEESNSGHRKGIRGRSISFTYKCNEGKDSGKLVTKTYKTGDFGFIAVPLYGLKEGSHSIDFEWKGDYYFNSLKGHIRIFITNNKTVTLAPNTINTSIPMKPHTVITPNDTFTVCVETPYGEPLNNQTVYIKGHDQTLKAVSDDLGHAKFKLNWENGTFPVTIYCEGMNNGFNNPQSVTMNLTCDGIYETNNRTVDFANYSLQTLHLKIPDKVNSETEYLQFVFYVTPPCESGTGENNEPYIKNNKVRVYFNDFMINTGDKALVYSESNRSFNTISFNDTYYALLYPNRDEEKGLEVIRPNRETINTKRILRSDITVFAPFITPILKEDRPEAVCLEYLNFHDQTVKISRE